MAPITKVLLIYWAVISLISIIVCIYDKYAAKSKPKSRVRESTLFILSALGGGIAMFITMLIIRHKTKHKSFMIGIPLIILLHIVLAALAFIFFGKQLFPALQIDVLSHLNIELTT